MDNIKLQNKIEIFSKRLKLLGVDMPLAAKYISIYQTVLMSQELSEDEFLLRKHIHFVGHVAQKQVFYPQKAPSFQLVLDKKVNNRKECVLFNGLELGDDLLALSKKIPKGVELEEMPRGVCGTASEITVYSFGKETELYYRMPALTLQEVLAQIPKEDLFRVECFSLDIEESPFDSYNMLLGMYAFKVRLHYL